MYARTVPAVAATGMAVTLVPADPVADGAFSVSSVGTNNQIAPGPDGNMWVTLDGATDVARITRAGVVTEFDDPAVSLPVGITAGPDGNLWVTYNGGVARFDPANPTTMTRTPIATISDPRAITSGPVVDPTPAKWRFRRL